MPDQPRRRLAPEVRRRQILDAAVAVFSEQGFHSASMDAVAARAGVSKPLVYAHGGTKEELFTACLRREGDRVLRRITEAATGDGATDPAAGAPGGPGAQARLWSGLRAFFGAVTARRAGWTVLYRQAATGAFAGEIAGEIAALRRRIVDGVARLLANELDAPVTAADLAPLAWTLVGAVEGLADWWLSEGEQPTEDAAAAADRLAGTVMALVWPGLDALRGGTAPPAPIASYPSVSDVR